MAPIQALQRRLPAIRAFVVRHGFDALVACAVAVGVFRLLLPYSNPSLESLRGKVYFWGDEGSVLYHAERIRHGEVLYRDFFDFQGLLGFLPFTIGFALRSAMPSTGRLVMYVLMAAWGAVMYLTSYEVTRKRWVGILVAVYFPLCVFPTWPYAYQHFIADFWITCALLCAMRAERGLFEGGWQWAGAFVGIALWTSLSEGGPALFAILASSVLIRYAKRSEWRFVGDYFAGVAAVTSLFVAYLIGTRSLSAAYEAILVFPFESYGSSNQTEYGFDGIRYINAWAPRGTFQGEVAKLLVDMTMKVPKYGIVVSLLVAALLLDRVLFRWYTRRVKHGKSIPWDTLAPCVLAASVGSLAVPVWLGVTRSDIAHIGFVQQMSVLALTVLWAPIAREKLKTLRWRFVLALQAFGGAMVIVLVLYPTGKFLYQNVRAAKPDKIDEVVAKDDHCAVIQARTRPQDRIVVNYGGFTYLTCKRDNAISFPHLFHETYWNGQWPIAAREIVQRKPRVLFLNSHDFDTLARYEPGLRTLYIGYDGNYMLATPRPGPPFEPAVWKYAVYGPAGYVKRGRLRFQTSTGSPPFYAFVDDGIRGAFTYLDGDTVQIFDGATTYVLERDPSGRTMQGLLFDALGERHVDAERDDL